jgi:hypothetical protein
VRADSLAKVEPDHGHEFVSRPDSLTPPIDQTSKASRHRYVDPQAGRLIRNGEVAQPRLRILHLIHGRNSEIFGRYP